MFVDVRMQQYVCKCCMVFSLCTCICGGICVHMYCVYAPTLRWPRHVLSLIGDTLYVGIHTTTKGEKERKRKREGREKKYKEPFLSGSPVQNRTWILEMVVRKHCMRHTSLFWLVQNRPNRGETTNQNYVWVDSGKKETNKFACVSLHIKNPTTRDFQSTWHILQRRLQTDEI